MRDVSLPLRGGGGAIPEESVEVLLSRGKEVEVGGFEGEEARFEIVEPGGDCWWAGDWAEDEAGGGVVVGLWGGEGGCVGGVVGCCCCCVGWRVDGGGICDGGGEGGWRGWRWR